MSDLRPADASGPAAPEDDDLPEPAPLRRLRLMVSTLLVVLIVGMITVVAALVIRLGLPVEGRTPPGGPIAAEVLTLPAGAEIVALGRARGEVLVVTRGPDGGETLRSFDAATGAALATTRIRRAAE